MEGANAAAIFRIVPVRIVEERFFFLMTGRVRSGLLGAKLATVMTSLAGGACAW